MKKIIVGIGLAIAVIAVLLYPGEMPYTVEGVGKVVPVRELIVTHGGEGLLVATLHDYVHGTKEVCFVTELERGDVAGFKLDPGIVPGAHVARGDTVGRLDSSNIAYMLVQMESELETKRAELKLALSGEKESIVEESRKELELAEEEYEEKRRIAERLKNLYEAGHTPYQEYEHAQSEMNLAKIAIERARAEIRTVASGVKQEEIDFIRAGIRGLEGELEALRNRRTRHTLTSPIEGVALDVAADTATGTIARIANTSGFCIIMPVRLQDSGLIETGKTVLVRGEGLPAPVAGKVIREGDSAHALNGGQVTLVTIELDSAETMPLTGAMVNCTVELESVTVREWLGRVIHRSFTW